MNEISNYFINLAENFFVQLWAEDPFSFSRNSRASAVQSVFAMDMCWPVKIRSLGPENYPFQQDFILGLHLYINFQFILFLHHAFIETVTVPECIVWFDKTTSRPHNECVDLTASSILGMTTSFIAFSIASWNLLQTSQRRWLFLMLSHRLICVQ